MLTSRNASRNTASIPGGHETASSVLNGEVKAVVCNLCMNLT
jgi:hypothetical protein